MSLSEEMFKGFPLLFEGGPLSEDNDLLDDAIAIHRYIHYINYYVQGISEGDRSKVPLTTVHLWILEILLIHHCRIGLSIREIERYTGLEHDSILELVQDFERQGIIERLPGIAPHWSYSCARLTDAALPYVRQCLVSYRRGALIKGLMLTDAKERKKIVESLARLKYLVKTANKLPR